MGCWCCWGKSGPVESKKVENHCLDHWMCPGFTKFNHHALKFYIVAILHKVAFCSLSMCKGLKNDHAWSFLCFSQRAVRYVLFQCATRRRHQHWIRPPLPSWSSRKHNGELIHQTECVIYRCMFNTAQLFNCQAALDLLLMRGDFRTSWHPLNDYHYTGTNSLLYIQIHKAFTSPSQSWCHSL